MFTKVQEKGDFSEFTGVGFLGGFPYFCNRSIDIPMNTLRKYRTLSCLLTLAVFMLFTGATLRPELQGLDKGKDGPIRVIRIQSGSSEFLAPNIHRVYNFHPPFPVTCCFVRPYFAMDSDPGACEGGYNGFPHVQGIFSSMLLEQICKLQI